MSKLKSKKQSITEIILDILSKTKNHINENYNDVLFKWWFTGRQDGLRLTEDGVLAFQLADIAYYDYPFVQDGQTYHNFILELNKKMSCPYYLGVNKTDKSKKTFYIRVYDSKVAVMLNLYGSLQDYLKSINLKK